MAEYPSSFFQLQDGLFMGNAPARGPWSAEHCHAGPVTGLLARSVEQLVGMERMLVRLTVDFIRPLPMQGFTIQTQLTRDGRRTATATATLIDQNERVCATATSMHILKNEIGEVKTAVVPKLPFKNLTFSSFPIKESLHDQPMFSHFAEVAYPEGEDSTIGPTTLWMKTLPLLADEAPTFFQRLCPLADCGNGFSRNANLSEMGFVNTDLTILAHRQTTAEWLASSAISHWHSHGIGMAQAVIQDEDGPVATALQSLILTPVNN